MDLLHDKTFALSIRLAAAAVALCVGACTSIPTAEEYRAGSALLEPVSGDAVLRDARARFRRVFCTVAEARDVDASADCEEYLWRLADEPAVAPRDDPLPALPPDLFVFVVGGAFSDCFGPASVAFRRGVERLRGEGIRIVIVPVSGRSSADLNAGRIAESFVAASLSATDRVILIGYSKGTVDIFHFLASRTEPGPRVAAVIGVSGPVWGSRAAERGAWLYDTLLANRFAGRCEPGDGGVVDSLTPEYRRRWMEEHALPRETRYYTLSAFTTRDYLARGLSPTWRMLAGEDRRNDGQVTLREGLLPGSVLLGYANADHWGLAIDIEQELDFIGARPVLRPFPRSVLFEALLRYVGDDLTGNGDESG